MNQPNDAASTLSEAAQRLGVFARALSRHDWTGALLDAYDPNAANNVPYDVAKAALIADLTVALAPSPELLAARDALRVAGEALEPYAAVAAEFSEREDDSFGLWRDCHVPEVKAAFTLGNSRRARDALAALTPALPSAEYLGDNGRDDAGETTGGSYEHPSS